MKKVIYSFAGIAFIAGAYLVCAPQSHHATSMRIGPCYYAAFEPHGKKAYVLDKESKQIIVVSADNNSIIKTFPIAGQPVSIDFESGTASALVSTLEGSIIFIDTAKDEVLGQMSLGVSSLESVTITHDGKTAFVTQRNGKISVIDVEKKRVVASLNAPTNTGVVISEDDKTFYAGRFASHEKIPMDLPNDAKGELKFISPSEAIVLSGSSGFSINGLKKAIECFDTDTGTFLSIVTTVENPLHMLGMVLSPTSKQLYVVVDDEMGNEPVDWFGPHQGKVLIIDTVTRKMIKRIPVTGHPYNIALNPNGKEAYITDYWKEEMRVLDIQKLTITRTIQLPQNVIQ